MGPTTDGDHSDQRFSTKDTLLKLLIKTGKSDLLTKVLKMWLSYNLTCVTSLLKLEKKMGRPERDPTLEEHEQILWEKGILGEDSPDKLRQTVFFYRC